MRNRNNVIFIIALLAIMMFTTSFATAESGKATSSLEDAMSGIIADKTCPESDVAGDEPENGPIFSNEELEFIENSGVITVGILADRVPFSFYNKTTKEIKGINVDILNLISEESGLKFEIVPIVEGESLVGEMLDGNTQLAIGVVRTEEILENKSLRVSSIILKNSLVVVARSGINYNPLKEYDVVSVPLWKQIEPVIRANLPNSNITYKDSIEECANLVAKGKADLFIENAGVVNLLLQKPCYGELEILPIYFDEEYSCIVQKSEENPVLMSIVDKSIAALCQEAVDQSIVRHTVASPYQLNFGDILYKYKAAIGIFLVAGILFLTLLWMMSRSKQRYFKELGEKNFQLMVAIDRAEKATALEKEKMKITETPFDLEGLIGYMSSGCYYKCQEKGIKFEVILKGIKGESLLGDQMNVSRIIFNLLINSVEFTEQGGKIKLYITQEDIGENRAILTFKVKDTGCGMSKEHMEKLFKPFDRKDHTPYGKTGWGLFITEHLVEMMGGEITVESEEGQGATFTVKLPFIISKQKKRLKLRELQAMEVLKIDVGNNKKDTEPEQDQAEEQIGRGKTVLGKSLDEDEGYNFLECKVLLAEEDEASREITLELLEMVGIETDCALSGEELVELFNDSEPYAYDIILLNINMSKYNGYEATKLIRQSDREDASTVPIIALTSDAFTDIVYEFRELGIDEYIAKPLDVNRLYRLLNRHYNQY